MQSFRKLITVLALPFLVVACSVVPLHVPVPENEESAATVPGFPANIRFWADEAPPNSRALISERIDAYRAANADYFEKHKTYPALHYLALSGGAYNGAFGAGLLSGWTDTGKRPDFALVTGVSAGALIAPFAFLGSRYDATLRTFFTTTNSDKIFVGGLWNFMSGITGGLALTDSTPLAKKIQTSITSDVMADIAAAHRKGRRLFIGTTNMEAQRGVIWDIGAIANSGNPNALNLIHQIILASASIPGVFRPVFIDVKVGNASYGEIHADGGVTSQVFVYPLKVQRSVVDEFSRYHMERHLYIIRNSKITPEYKVLQPGFFTLSQRSVETLAKYQGLGDLYRLYLSTQRDGIDYNLVYIPSGFNAKTKEYFDPVYMSQLFDVGYTMAKQPGTWMKKPPNLDYSPDEP